jgi:hypothetical protein
VHIAVDCHQIATKTAEFFNRRSLALDICVCVAHRDTDAGMSQQFSHRHDVNAAVYETRSKSVAHSVPRHTRDSRFLTSESECSFQINKWFAGLRIAENTFILFAQPPSFKNLVSLRIYRNLSDRLGLGCKDSQNSFP